jgi:hypothetical protein
MTKVPPRIELGSPDSESDVLTITPWDLSISHKQRTIDHYRWDSTNGNQTLVGTTRLRRGNTLYNIAG